MWNRWQKPIYICGYWWRLIADAKMCLCLTRRDISEIVVFCSFSSFPISFPTSFFFFFSTSLWNWTSFYVSITRSLYFCSCSKLFNSLYFFQQNFFSKPKNLSTFVFFPCIMTLKLLFPIYILTLFIALFTALLYFLFFLFQNVYSSH